MTRFMEMCQTEVLKGFSAKLEQCNRDPRQVRQVLLLLHTGASSANSSLLRTST